MAFISSALLHNDETHDIYCTHTLTNSRTLQPALPWHSHPHLHTMSASHAHSPDGQNETKHIRINREDEDAQNHENQSLHYHHHRVEGERHRITTESRADDPMRLSSMISRDVPHHDQVSISSIRQLEKENSPSRRESSAMPEDRASKPPLRTQPSMGSDDNDKSTASTGLSPSTHILSANMQNHETEDAIRDSKSHLHSPTQEAHSTTGPSAPGPPPIPAPTTHSTYDDQYRWGTSHSDQHDARARASSPYVSRHFEGHEDASLSVGSVPQPNSHPASQPHSQVEPPIRLPRHDTHERPVSSPLSSGPHHQDRKSVV